MSFFSKAKNVLINGKRAVCRGVGDALEKIGEVTRISPIEMAGIYLWSDNPVYFEDAIDVNSSDTSVSDTINIHKKCEETRQVIATRAKNIEDKIVDELEEDINKFIDALAEVFPENVLAEFNYSIEKSFEDDVHNTVSDYVSVHISQDSEEFVNILKIIDDSERLEKTKEYEKRILNEAMKLLQKKCQSKKIGTYRRMLDDLQTYFTNEKNVVEELKKNMEELQEHKDDMCFYAEKATETVKDMNYMECIRTLTYKNS